MPLIEVLPNSKSVTAPGWAYVADTNYQDPSKVAIQPSSRHRAARNTGGEDSGHDRSARQNNAITKHLAELDKDNHRDVQIAIPARQKGTVGRGAKGKTTGAVRRILASQKTFANYLADEEAAPAIPPPPSLTSKPSTGGTAEAKKAGEKRSHKKKVPLSATPSDQRLGRDSVEQVEEKLPAATMTTATTSASVTSATTATQMLPISPDDLEPLLKSSTPLETPAEILEDLTRAPPLSYAASRAGPSTLGRPPRSFCEICGYWGRVKCLKCGAKVCGLDCKVAHDESRCLKFYA